MIFRVIALCWGCALVAVGVYFSIWPRERREVRFGGATFDGVDYNGGEQRDIIDDDGWHACRCVRIARDPAGAMEE